jgi:hypothetical protein
VQRKQHPTLIERVKVLEEIWRDGRLTPTTKLIAGVILLSFFNDKTGQCNPSYRRLAKELSVGKATAVKASIALRDSGYLDRITDADGRSNYRLGSRAESHLSGHVNERPSDDPGVRYGSMGGSVANRGVVRERIGGGSVANRGWFRSEPRVVRERIGGGSVAKPEPTKEPTKEPTNRTELTEQVEEPQPIFEDWDDIAF